MNVLSLSPLISYFFFSARPSQLRIAEGKERPRYFKTLEKPGTRTCAGKRRAQVILHFPLSISILFRSIPFYSISGQNPRDDDEDDDGRKEENKKMQRLFVQSHAPSTDNQPRKSLLINSRASSRYFQPLRRMAEVDFFPSYQQQAGY